MTSLDAEIQRRFAVAAATKLRAAGYEALWAGGCVRDRLLGRAPKDYDVATNAKPDEVREVFGRRRTRPVGAAFGVVLVEGPPGAGAIEVATFRSDLGYSDGRRPDAVAFASAREDAARRDFTLNGLFYDPLADEVIDYVGGRDDLAARRLRAIGDPVARFAEDKLRLLRAVRFAARFELAIEPATFAALRSMAPTCAVVSAERIAGEMRHIVTDPNRVRGVRLLLASGLAAAVLPEIVADDERGRRRLERSLAVLGELSDPDFPLALAALVAEFVDGDGAEVLARRWRLSNRQAERLAWLVERRYALGGSPQLPWSRVQPLLVAPGAADLVALVEAGARAGQDDPADAAWLRDRLEQPREALDPPPWVGGDDLQAAGFAPGPALGEALTRARAAQLDGEVAAREEALALALRTFETSTPSDPMDKRLKKRLDAVHQRVQRLRQQLAGAKRQNDDPAETAALERQVAEAEAELAKLRTG